MKKTKVAILVRVSTSKQETTRQIEELTEHALANDYQIIAILEESISGAAHMRSRTGLLECEKLAQKGDIDKVLVHEVSRLARKNSIAHSFVESMTELGVSVYWHSQKVETLLEDGSPNPAAGIMFALLAEMARNERETLSARVKSGLKSARKRGRRLGRPTGTQDSEADTLEKYPHVVKLLRKGISIRNVAQIVGKSPTTVHKIRKCLPSMAN